MEYFLEKEPPDWCIESDKWPYQSQAWKDWLRKKRAHVKRPLPPDLARALGLGDQLRERKDFTACAVAYSTAIEMIEELVKDDWTIFYFGGICDERSGDWSKAEGDRGITEVVQH